MSSVQIKNKSRLSQANHARLMVPKFIMVSILLELILSINRANFPKLPPHKYLVLANFPYFPYFYG